MLAVSVVLAATGAAGAAPVAAAASRPVFRFADGRIDEASGIGVGIASPGVVYVQNDSGDSARFFAVDASTGATLAVYSVPGAQNVDWEDLAVARDARGVPSVWLADIGDNDAVRQEVRIYRVDEPVVDRDRVGLELTTAEPSVWRLRYPDGLTNNINILQIFRQTCQGCELSCGPLADLRISHLGSGRARCAARPPLTAQPRR